MGVWGDGEGVGEGLGKWGGVGGLGESLMTLWDFVTDRDSSDAKDGDFIYFTFLSI